MLDEVAISPGGDVFIIVVHSVSMKWPAVFCLFENHKVSLGNGARVAGEAQ